MGYLMSSIETTTDKSFILHKEGVSHMRPVRQPIIHSRDKRWIPRHVAPPFNCYKEINGCKSNHYLISFDSPLNVQLYEGVKILCHI